MPSPSTAVSFRAAAFNTSLAQPTDLAAGLSITEADLDRLVRQFYARAIEDELIGPVFRRAVADWEHHFETIRNFWSKTLLGTSRYTGNPFSAHIEPRSPGRSSSIAGSISSA